jgi:long-chain acyl-CoA synthetase
MSIDFSLTIPDLFRRAVAERGNQPALLSKFNGRYEQESWRDLLGAVSGFLRLLAASALRQGDLAVHISHNRREWVLFDLACHLLGVVHVPLHCTLSGPQLLEQIRHCGAKHVFLGDDGQQQKLAGCGDEFRILRYDDLTQSRGARIETPQLQMADVRPDDLATILYTSGTTGEPKGVMLTQRNLSSNAQAAAEGFGPEEQELKLNILPLSHIFARTCDLYIWLTRGSTLAIAESRETALQDLQAVRPSSMNGVPYFYDRLRRVLCERGDEHKPGALRELLGGRIRTCCSGGAPLPQATIDFFASHDIPLLQGYGLSESSPVIVSSTIAANRPGCSGRPIAGVEIRLANDGELLTRGPHVMAGYYKNPAATAEVIRDSWLHTGDLGQIDADGYLRIIGRKKEMIVLSTGKKVAPTTIENLLSQDPLIAQVMVVGEGRSHLAALVVPQPDALKAEIASQGIVVHSREEALAHPQVLGCYLQRMKQHLCGLSPQEQVHHVALLPRAFAIDAGEMTAKLSLRRDVICRNFAEEIENMYRISSPNAC